MNICEHELKCTMKDRYCKECKHNPNAELQDYYRDREYIPTCPYGYEDCINDPAKHGEEGICRCACEGSCEDGNWYDDEDK